MPIYEYRAISDGCDHCQDGFELLQRMGEEALSTCPECGRAIAKLISTFGVAEGKGDPMSQKSLEKNGFTQYTKTSDGRYERSAGTGGPKIIEKK